MKRATHWKWSYSVTRKHNWSSRFIFIQLSTFLTFSKFSTFKNVLNVFFISEPTFSHIHGTLYDYTANRPESTQVVGDGVFAEILGRDHKLATAESRRVVRHPRHRLARLDLYVSVLVQPVVCMVYQLPALAPAIASIIIFVASTMHVLESSQRA